MNRNVRLLFSPPVFKAVQKHLFPGDNCEHAGVLLCGWNERADRITLTANEFQPARDGIDYTVSPEFHGRLQPLFIEDALSKAKERRLSYVAIHNHMACDSVSFSQVDMASHEYGYPTLSRLNRGLPVGAAVFGTSSIEVDIWMPGGKRHSLETARVVDQWIRHLWSSPRFAPQVAYDEQFDRQLPFLRNAGLGLIAEAIVGIVGLGGLGSQLIEPLVRLGFRRFVLLDPDRMDRSNYSRVHGSLPIDLPASSKPGNLKVEIAKRLILAIAPDATVDAQPLDVARGDAHQCLLGCDFVFLAADTAEARLTCNALVHQYYIPMVQIGTKVHIDTNGVLHGVFGAVRQLRPGKGCLWCNGLIDRVALADSGKTQTQRDNERYGADAPSPSVVAFNAEVAGRALNDFLRHYATPQPSFGPFYEYSMLDLLAGEREFVEARADEQCSFCSASNSSSSHGRSGGSQVPIVGL